MKDLFLVRPLYGLFYVMRLLFLTGPVGARVHNAFFYLIGLPIAQQPQERRWFRALRESLGRRDTAFVRWQARMYTSTPAAWKHALRHLIIHHKILGAARRRQLERQGHVVPTVLAISPSTPTSGCNLRCAHCFADSHPAAILPRDVFAKVLREEEALCIFSVLVSGGEPFLYKGIWELFAEFPRTSFYVPTNGTQFSAEVVAQLCELGNVFPMFSLEGPREQTDAIRGNGVFDQVAEAMRLCRTRRLPYAVTVTVTRQNVDVVTSDEFLRWLDDHRCCMVNFSSYVAVGSDPHPEWEITAFQSEAIDRVGEHIRQTYAMMPSIGRNGTSRVSGCFAGRQYFHVLATGQVEGCVFAHWADPSLNIRERTILEITASPFFRALRAIADQGIPGVTPCRAGRHEIMERFFRQEGAEPTVKTVRREAPWQPPLVEISSTSSPSRSQ